MGTKNIADDGFNVLSELKNEKRFLIADFNDVAKLEENFKDKKFDACVELINRLQKDKEVLILEHQALTMLANDWYGDFAKELAIDGGIVSDKRIHEGFDIIYGIRKDIGVIFDKCDKLFNSIITHFNSKTVQQIKELQYKELADKTDVLLNALSEWIDVDKRLIVVVEKCDKFIKDFESSHIDELDNYRNIKTHLDEIIRGKGKYFLLNEKDRKLILSRYIRSNPNAFNNEPDIKNKIQNFISRDTLTSNLSIEPKCIREDMSFDKSLNRLLSAGYNRHLRPAEYFSIIFDAIENPWCRNKELVYDMINYHGEWLSMAFRKEGGKLIVALDPKNIIWDGTKYIIDGAEIVCSIKKEFYIGHIKKFNGYGNNLSNLPSELVNFIFGVTFEKFENRDTGIYLPLNEFEWWPVSRSSADARFSVGADSTSKYSRGVR